MLKKQAYGQRLFEQLFWRKFGCFWLLGVAPQGGSSSFLLSLREFLLLGGFSLLILWVLQLYQEKTVFVRVKYFYFDVKWSDLGRFLVFGVGIVHRTAESGSDGLKMRLLLVRGAAFERRKRTKSLGLPHREAGVFHSICWHSRYFYYLCTQNQTSKIWDRKKT